LLDRSGYSDDKFPLVGEMVFDEDVQSQPRLREIIVSESWIACFAFFSPFHFIVRLPPFCHLNECTPIFLASRDWSFGKFAKSYSLLDWIQRRLVLCSNKSFFSFHFRLGLANSG
jgi:hypothetical protein